MNELLEIGFEPAGHWRLHENALQCELVRHAAQRNVLYAFVCEGEVRYVGKTTQTLAARMGGYRNPGRTQRTNINNHERIKSVLGRGEAVEILVLPDNGLLHYGPFHLNLAAGLEDDIIRVLDPGWNGGVAEPPDPALSAEAPPLEATASFEFTLQPTYYAQGFFNVGVSDQQRIGRDGETIELFLGDSEQPRLGTIDRRATSNGTPRIRGGTALRDWFRAHAAVKDSIRVEVFSPTSIRLRRTDTPVGVG